MSKDRLIDPRADMLMGSMRSMGYSFEAAIADIIDNSITAKASTIRILFPSTPMDELAIGILDDGLGMSSQTLLEAMRYGSTASEEARDEEDLGRFGLGLKSASLSQCKLLTVVSYFENRVSSFSWDYDYILNQKKWVTKELDDNEISCLPYYKELLELKRGTLIIWQNFDTLHKSNEGLVFDALNGLRSKLDQYLGLVFHRFLSSKNKNLKIYINNHRIIPLDPFLESHPKTTTKKERSIAIHDSSGNERLIYIKPFILPFISDLSENDKKLIGGLENLRQRQGFYIYRNNRLIIWGTWFGMKPRAELTKNARIRVDIPNSLDDIWSINITKQTASLPKRIQNQLKNTVIQALEISTIKHTHRGRKENIDEERDYIWQRYADRNSSYYYTVNQESKLFKYVQSQMDEKDFDLFLMFLGEVEKNIPIQQMYVDRSNDKVTFQIPDTRLDDVFQMSVTLASTIHAATNRSYEEIIDDIMKSEPFCNYNEIKEKLIENFNHAS